MVDVLELYEALERQIKTSNPKVDVNRVRAAFEYAHAHHGPQLRKSGEPYIIHPIAVAEIINELGLDADSIVAALLHDCIEDPKKAAASSPATPLAFRIVPPRAPFSRATSIASSAKPELTMAKITS